MGFFDKNPPDKYAKNDYLTVDEVKQLIDQGTVLEITGVSYRPEGKYGPTHELQLNIEGEEKKKSFTQGSVEGRDQMLDDMLTHFSENGSEPIAVRFVSWGAAVGIVPA